MGRDFGYWRKRMRKGVMKIYAAERWLYLHHFRLIPKILKVFIRIVFNATIPYTCEIGGGSLFPHGGSGVVLHEHCVIGSDCRIQANVVIGGRNGLPGAPKIGNNVLIGAGAVLLGDINIGEHAQIGANAVVTHDVPAYTVVVGVPARVIKNLKQDN
jgi:serine acetyltransferase